MKIVIGQPNLRDLTNLSNNTLEKHGGKDGTIPEHIKGQVALSVLKDLTQTKNFFDVCKVNELAQMNEISISAEHRELFQTLHCIYWDDIHEDTREYIIALLVQYFKGNMVMANSTLNKND